METNLVVSREIIDCRGDREFSEIFGELVNRRGHAGLFDCDAVEGLYIIDHSPLTRFLWDEEVARSIGSLGVFKNPEFLFLLDDRRSCILSRFWKSDIVLLPRLMRYGV